MWPDAEDFLVQTTRLLGQRGKPLHGSMDGGWVQLHGGTLLRMPVQQEPDQSFAGTDPSIVKILQLKASNYTDVWFVQ